MLYGSSHNLGQRAAIPHGGDVGPFRWCYVTCNNSCSLCTWNVTIRHMCWTPSALFETEPQSLICHGSTLPLSPICPAANRTCLSLLCFHLCSRNPMPGSGAAAGITRNDCKKPCIPGLLFFSWKIIWLLAFIFVWNNVGKTYLNDNCTQILSVKWDIRNHTERVQEAARTSLPFKFFFFYPFSAFQCIRQKL